MKPVRLVLLVAIVLTGCGRQQAPAPAQTAADPYADFMAKLPKKAESLVLARKALKTKLTRQDSAKEPVPEPPADLFQLTHYESAPGKMAAYLTPDPKDGKKHPAIIWMTGGDCNTIGDVWTEAPPEDDQTASAFRKAGIVMMFPSLRGGNDNPGVKECLLGEVDDILAAADFLAKQEYVDPSRIYLGGHSTGGTLVLLVAECSDRFRAVFSFGPVTEIQKYGADFMPFDRSDHFEREARSPSNWLFMIKNPTFVFEGTEEGNVDELHDMASTDNTSVHCLEIKGGTHFSVLAPTTTLIASKILLDDGPKCNLSFTEDELKQPFAK
ncbi:MAG: Alpha/beta hydrolase family protein [Planctomycetaceae bacterium]|nr:Alpha/beta hydrolase family protein [Planctomycetaceae bacterium]